jgi:hypothetical protein
VSLSSCPLPAARGLSLVGARLESGCGKGVSKLLAHEGTHLCVACAVSLASTIPEGITKPKPVQIEKVATQRDPEDGAAVVKVEQKGAKPPPKNAVSPMGREPLGTAIPPVIAPTGRQDPMALFRRLMNAFDALAFINVTGRASGVSECVCVCVCVRVRVRVRVCVCVCACVCVCV